MWLHFEYQAVPYRSNLLFSISDIRALWHSGLIAKVRVKCECRMSEIENNRLGLYRSLV